MNLWDVAPVVLPIVAGLVMWWVRDRRKDRAAAAVAEGSVDAEVAVKDIGAQDARLVHIAKSWETERAGLVRAIADRDREIDWQRNELERRDGMIAHRDLLIDGLRRELDEVEGHLADVTRQLIAARHQLDEFDQRKSTEHTP